MILLHGWSHFWKATTITKSMTEVATMASGKPQETEASHSTASFSSLKVFPPVSGCLNASCLTLAFFAAKKEQIRLVQLLKDSPVTQNGMTIRMWETNWRRIMTQLSTRCLLCLLFSWERSPPPELHSP